MEIETLLLFFVLALVAEIVGTVGGFGSSLFFVPMASYFFDFQSVLGITALFHVLSNLTKIGYFRKGFDLKIIILMGIPAVVLVILGAYLSRLVQTQWLEMALALFLIGFSLLFLAFPAIKIKPTGLNAGLGGAVSGFIAGLVGTGGAIRGMTLAAFNLSKDVFISTSAWIDLGIDLSRSVVYYSNGYMHANAFYIIPGLLVASIAGTGIGKWILEYVSDDQFRRLVLFLILIIGLLMMFRIYQK